MEFVAIDVETANPDMASICQVGVVHFQDGHYIKEWVSYIDPEDYFDMVNRSIHGIDEKTVAGSPNFKEASKILFKLLNNRIIVCHTHFDRVALKQACEKSDIVFPNSTWLDSARVARRTWSQFARSGYGLKNICKNLGYEFKHHDALEDAKAAAHILIEATKEKGIDLDGWLNHLNRRKDSSRSGSGTKIKRDGNPDGPLFGEVLVFTGSLQISRLEAADLAAGIGCKVARGVTKKTTILVVGDQNVTQSIEKEKTSKYLKAEQLILNGINIRILRETDFKELVALSK